jgi:WD40-like Beta Propeller Repeat
MTRCASVSVVVGAFVLGALVVGCAPASRMWFGHSADRLHRVDVWDDGNHQWVELDGVRQRRVRSVALGTVALSEHGEHLAYAVETKVGWRLEFDGAAGRHHDAVGDLAMASHGWRVAYAAMDEGVWSVWEAGRAGPGFDAILRDTLTFSPDGRRFAYAARRGKASYVVLDGSEGPAFDGIRSLAFGPTGRLVYVARKPDGAQVVNDGVPGFVYQGIGEVVVGSSRVAYAALGERGWRAVVDGREGPVFRRVDDLRINRQDRLAYVATREDGARQVVVEGVAVATHRAISRRSLQVGPKGRLAFIARDEGGMHMRLDGEPGPSFEGIENAVFADRGSRWGYVAQRAGRTTVVIDGAPMGSWDWAADLVFSPDGRRYAFAAHVDGRDVVVADGAVRTVAKIVVGTLAFDSQSRRLGYVIGDPQTRRFHFAADGLASRPFILGELVAAAAVDPDQLRSDPEIMRRWVVAELERPSMGGKR